MDCNRKIFAFSEDLDARLPFEYSINVYSDFEDVVEQEIASLIAAVGTEKSDHQDRNSRTPNNSMTRMVHLPKIAIEPFDGHPLK